EVPPESRSREFVYKPLSLLLLVDLWTREERKMFILPRPCGASELLEKLLDDQLRRHIEQPLADARDHAADLDFAVVLDFSRSLGGEQREDALALEKAHFARAFHQQPEAVGRVLIGEPDLASEQPLDARDHHLHLHLVLVLADLVETIATGHAAGENLRVLQLCVSELRIE